MNDNAVPLPSAANKDPAEPSAKPRRRRAVAVSPGNGVVKQIFDFIQDMSAGNLVQRCIAVFVAVVLPVLFMAASVYIVVTRPGSTLLVGGASIVSGGTVLIANRWRQRRAKATGDEPRN